MKMYCKYCDHEKNGSKLLLLVDKEISLRTCGTETSGRGFPNSNEGDLLEGLDPGKNGHRTFSRRTWSWLKGLHKCPSTFTIPKDSLTLSRVAPSAVSKGWGGLIGPPHVSKGVGVVLVSNFSCSLRSDQD